MKTILTIVLFSLLGQISNAQTPKHREVVGAAGEELKSNQGTLNFTVGEVVTETFTDSTSNIILTEGFHQTYYKITSLKKDPDWDFDFKFWPNPFFQFVNIDFSLLEEPVFLKVQVYNALGALVKEIKITDPTKIDLQYLSAATYFIRIIDTSNGKVAVFKIVKI